MADFASLTRIAYHVTRKLDCTQILAQHVMDNTTTHEVSSKLVEKMWTNVHVHSLWV